MESYHGMILCIISANHLYEKDPGAARTSPEPPVIPRIPWARVWDPRGRPRDPKARSWDRMGTSLRRPGTPVGPPGTSRGPPRDFSGTPVDPWGPLWDPLWITKTIISRQVDTARSSRLLCSNLLVRAHRVDDSTRTFYL